MADKGNSTAAEGSNKIDFAELIRQQMAAVAPETEEQRAAREARERRVGFLSRVADGLGSFHTAFAHARGVQPMTMPQIGAKAQERFDRAKTERERNRDHYMNFAQMLDRIREREQEYDYRKERDANQRLLSWSQFYAARQERAAEEARRAAMDAQAQQRWQAEQEAKARQNAQTNAISRERIKQQSEAAQLRARGGNGGRGQGYGDTTQHDRGRGY